MTMMSQRTRVAINTDIEGQILSGSLAPGDRLPSERRLAGQFFVSRPVVREVLRGLAERGLIEIAPSRGAFVSGVSSLAGLRPLDVLYRRRGATARQISEVRLVLEAEAASLAAERAELEQVDDLRARLERLEASHEPIETVRADLAFHLGVAAASRNPVIEAMLGSIATFTMELMVRSLGDPEVTARSAPYHKKIYEAIAARDPISAREAMRAHLSVARDTYGLDYDRNLDAMAIRALRRLGSSLSLEDFLREAGAGQVEAR